jgi:isoprenylcysteine carboxyl methyltransferase (ICMT) family protein YpbQ
MGTDWRDSWRGLVFVLLNECHRIIQLVTNNYRACQHSEFLLELHPCNVFLCVIQQSKMTTMEEKVNEILGIESEEISLKELTDQAMKAASEDPTTEKKDVNNAEKTLSTIADIILFVGIIVTVICLPTVCFADEEFSPSGFITTVMVLFSSLISWSIMHVLANISFTLKELNSKIKTEE